MAAYKSACLIVCSIVCLFVRLLACLLACLLAFSSTCLFACLLASPARPDSISNLANKASRPISLPASQRCLPASAACQPAQPANTGCIDEPQQTLHAACALFQLSLSEGSIEEMCVCTAAHRCLRQHPRRYGNAPSYSGQKLVTVFASETIRKTAMPQCGDRPENNN